VILDGLPLSLFPQVFRLLPKERHWNILLASSQFVLQITDGNAHEVTNMSRHPFDAVPKLCLAKFTLQILTKSSVVETLVKWTDCTGNFRFRFLPIPDNNFRALRYRQQSVDSLSSGCPD
jgi:hypothetical protein